MTLMTTIFVVCGKVNDTNLSRYSDYSERTYRRHVEAGLGLEGMNQALIEPVIADVSPRIAVVDCTLTEPNGRHTYGLDGVYIELRGYSRLGWSRQTPKSVRSVVITQRGDAPQAPHLIEVDESGMDE